MLEKALKKLKRIDMKKVRNVPYDVLDNFERQLAHARELLARNGIPSFLEGHENEITFRAVVRPEQVVVQSRYVGDKWGLELFLEGATSAAALEGKITAQQAVVQSFIRQLERGAFHPVERQRRGGVELKDVA